MNIMLLHLAWKFSSFPNYVCNFYLWIIVIDNLKSLDVFDTGQRVVRGLFS